MHIPVITPDGKQAFFLQLNESSHILSFNRKLEIFIAPDTYYYFVNVISELGLSTEGSEDSKFIMVNQSTMVNLDNVVDFDKSKNMIYFHSGDKVLHASVSTRNVSKIMKHMKEKTRSKTS